MDRADRQDRRRQGKSDPLDAVSAARAAQSGRAAGAPKGRDGAVEAIRALMVAKRSARNERTQAINQARALILTGPDELRARFAGHRAAALAAGIAALRPRPGDAAEYAVRVALRELGRRVEFLDAQIERLDDLIVPLVTVRAPGLLSLYGVGPDTAALLLGRSDFLPAQWIRLHGHHPQGRESMRDYSSPCIDMRHDNALISADPDVRCLVPSGRACRIAHAGHSSGSLGPLSLRAVAAG